MEELFQSLLCMYKIRLKTSMKGNDFIFVCVLLLYRKCYKTNFKRGGLYTDSLDCIKNKETGINPIDKKIMINAFNTL